MVMGVASITGVEPVSVLSIWLSVAVVQEIELSILNTP